MVPRTLIQIHYHNAAGGVAQVMGYYARAFARINKDRRFSSLLVCHDRGASSFPDSAVIVSDSRCDYHEYRSVKAYERATASLTTFLIKHLADTSLPGPVAVLGHNMNLGKNCALSSALAQCARRLSDDPKYRFISLVHDRAEEGRCAQQRQIEFLERCGVKIWNDLYPRSPNVIFGVLNRSAQRDLDRRRLDPLLLFNPIELPRINRLKETTSNAIAAGLTRLARGDGTAFDPKRPTICYPARITARKNILEAMLIACVAGNCNLLLGGCGASASDRRLFERLRKFCRARRLRVVLDCDRLPLPKGEGSSGARMFLLLTLFAKATLSTSVLEGFGYALYEPWAVRKPVFGRQPDNCLFPPAMDTSTCYERCLVPASFVDTNRIRAKYREKFRASVEIGSEIDFALLDAKEQFRVLDSVIRNPSMISGMRVVWRGPAQRSVSLSELFQLKADVDRNRRFVVRTFSFDRFVVQLRMLLRNNPKALPSASRVQLRAAPEPSKKVRLLLAD